MPHTHTPSADPTPDSVKFVVPPSGGTTTAQPLNSHPASPSQKFVVPPSGGITTDQPLNSTPIPDSVKFVVPPSGGTTTNQALNSTPTPDSVKFVVPPSGGITTDQPLNSTPTPSSESQLEPQASAISPSVPPSVSPVSSVVDNSSEIPQSEIRNPQSNAPDTGSPHHRPLRFPDFSDSPTEITDLSTLSEAVAIGECMIVEWFRSMEHSPITPIPAFVNLSIDTLARMTAIHKSVIHMAYLAKKLESLGVPSSGGIKTDPTPNSQKFVVPPSGGTTTAQPLDTAPTPSSEFSFGVQASACSASVSSVPSVVDNPSEIPQPKNADLPIGTQATQESGVPGFNKPAPPAFPQIPQSEIPHSAIRTPQFPLATFPPEDRLPAHLIQQGERPNLFLNHDQLQISCPDPEPRIPVIRELATIPPDRLSSSITKAFDSLKNLPKASDPHIHPLNRANFEAASKSLTDSLSKSTQSIRSTQSTSSTPQSTQDSELRTQNFFKRPFGTFYVDMDNLPEGHPLLRRNKSP